MNLKDLNTIDLESYDVLVVGAGFSGSVVARRSAEELGKRVLVLDKREHVGGNSHDYIDQKSRVRASLYGAHLFHTSVGRVWDFVRKYSEWMSYEHKVLGKVDGKLVPIPVNILTVQLLCDDTVKTSEDMKIWLAKNQEPIAKPTNGEEAGLSQVGQFLYEKIFKHYTKKQWGRYPSELDASVLQRIPVRDNFDDGYFSDRYQVLPTEGYTAFFEKLLSHPKIDIALNTDYSSVAQNIPEATFVFYTGHIDNYFTCLGYEALDYRSISFEIERYPELEFYQENSVVNYTGSDENFTRIVEYKHFPNQATSEFDGTFIVKEYSTDSGEPYYPVPDRRNSALFDKYWSAAKKEKNVCFLGRLGRYKYLDMDKAVLGALEAFDNSISRTIVSGSLISFVTFHKTLYEEHYHGLVKRLGDICFVAVNEALRKNIPNRLAHRVKNEWQFDHFNSALQECGYDESSVFYHVYKNDLYRDRDFIGFFQYDMTLSDDVIDRIVKYPNAESKVFFQSMWLENFSGYPISKYLLRKYNEYFGTNVPFKVLKGHRPFVMCASFVIHRSLYLKIAPWICHLIEDPQLFTCVQVCAGTEKRVGRSLWVGNVLERAYGLALFLENDVEFVKIDSTHVREPQVRKTFADVEERYKADIEFARVLLLLTFKTSNSIEQRIASIFLLSYLFVIDLSLLVSMRFRAYYASLKKRRFRGKTPAMVLLMRRYFASLFKIAKRKGLVRTTITSEECKRFGRRRV